MRLLAKIGWFAVRVAQLEPVVVVGGLMMILNQSCCQEVRLLRRILARCIQVALV